MITGSTEILTPQGWKTPRDLDEVVSVLDPATGKWGLATLTLEDAAPYWVYQLVPVYNTGDQRVCEFKAPRPCGVSLRNNSYTYDMRQGDVLSVNQYDCGYDPEAWGRGFMYRFDILGTTGLVPSKYPLYRDRLESLKTSGQIKASDGTLPVAEMPFVKGSFIRGYLAADGNKPKLATTDKALFDFFVENYGYAGLVLTGAERKVRKFLKVKNIAEFYDSYEVAYQKGADFQGYKVASLAGPSDRTDTLYSICLSDQCDIVIKGGWTVRGD